MLERRVLYLRRFAILDLPLRLNGIKPANDIRNRPGGVLSELREGGAGLREKVIRLPWIDAERGYWERNGQY